MTATRLRSLGVVLLAIVCAVVLGMTSMLTSAFVFGVEKVLADWAQIKLLADEGFIMSGTGQPDPTVGPYIDQVEGLYLQPPSPLFPGQPTFDTYNFQGLTTPEQFCPFVCLPPPNPQLTFGDSLAQGETHLTNAIVPGLQAGDNVAVFGYSQSATIATQVANNLIDNPPTGVDPSDLHVVLIGDPNTPIGGILDRFQFPDGVEPFSLTPAPQHVPFVNIPLSMPPTSTTDVPTDVYTGEYDAYADFPQAPLNILADINALIGIVTVHPYYPGYTPDQLADTIDVGTVGDTNFYMIPENLPILQFMFNGGTAGQFFGDFFSPWARLIIDWSYGNAGDPGDLLHPGPAGGSAVDGLYAIPSAVNTEGANIAGSPYEETFGVAGGPWAATPLGDLYDGSAFTSAADSGIAGLFMKMDPLQMLAGVDNALIQSVVGPWVDVAASGGPLSSGTIDVVDGITQTLRFVTGYDLINLVDQGLLGVWTGGLDLLQDGLDAVGLEDVDLENIIGPGALLDGPLIPGQPIIDLVGGVFDIFNFFGA